MGGGGAFWRLVDRYYIPGPEDVILATDDWLCLTKVEQGSVIVLSRIPEILLIQRIYPNAAAFLHWDDLDDFYMMLMEIRFRRPYLSKKYLECDSNQSNETFEKLLHSEGCTPLEILIAKCLLNHETNPDIARKLKIAVKTVENHKNRLGQKLGTVGRGALERKLFHLQSSATT